MIVAFIEKQVHTTINFYLSVQGPFSALGLSKATNLFTSRLSETCNINSKKTHSKNPGPTPRGLAPAWHSPSSSGKLYCSQHHPSMVPISLEQ